ncbi:hypothetical protein BH11PSE11_BH11PSE11_18930 [soil metagenome]
MPNWIAAWGLCIALLPASSTAIAADRASAPEAIAFVQSAVAHLRKNGREKAFADFNDIKNTKFHDRDLYVFVYDMNGVNMAHGNSPKMIGKDLMSLKDADGKQIFKHFLEVVNAKGRGWVDYAWPNPVTKSVEKKSSYIEKVDDLIVGSGIYKN